MPPIGIAIKAHPICDEPRSTALSSKAPTHSTRRSQDTLRRNRRSSIRHCCLWDHVLFASFKTYSSVSKAPTHPTRRPQAHIEDDHAFPLHNYLLDTLIHSASLICKHISLTKHILGTISQFFSRSSTECSLWMGTPLDAEDTRFRSLPSNHILSALIYLLTSLQKPCACRNPGEARPPW